MEDEVLEVNEFSEEMNPISEEINTEEQTEVQEIQQEKEKKFSVDNIEFNEEYNFGGYDFSKFKGRIDESSLPLLEEYAKKYQEQGFTQAQIEFLMEENLSESPKDMDSVMKELQNSLTMEEKQSYRSTANKVKQALEKSNLGKYYEEIMTNPIAFKVVNALVKSLTPGVDIGARTERESRMTKLSGYQAVEKFNEYMRANIGNADVQGKAKELLAMVGTEEDRKYFKETLGL